MSVDNEDSIKSELVSAIKSKYPCLLMDLDEVDDCARSSYIDENIDEWFYDQ